MIAPASTRPAFDADALLRNHSVIVCVGTGGVGKTSVSATLGIRAATLGLRTLVMTIDPAKRLIDALGINPDDAKQHAPCEVPHTAFAPWGITLHAPLWVMVPNTQAIFDELVTQFSSNPAQLLRNPIYRYVSTALSGAHDYAAVEKLYRVHDESTYDLVILDTPPSHNALDFFTAPTRIADFFDSEAIQWLQKPVQLAQKWSLPWMNVGSSVANKAIGKLAGPATIGAVLEFLQGFQGMYDGFVKRSRSVRDLLRSPKTAFMLITTPQPKNAYHLWQIQQRMAQEGFAIHAIAANRVRRAPYAREQAQAVHTSIRGALSAYSAEEQEMVLQALTEEAMLAERDQETLNTIADTLVDVPVITLPELAEDIHDLDGLRALYAALQTSGSA